MFHFWKSIVLYKTSHIRLKSSTSIQLGGSSNGGIKWIAGGWAVFLAENVILSENREWICRYYGEKMYHGIYNTLSSAACLSILFGYFKHKGKGRKWANFTKGSAPMPLRIGSIVLQTFGVVCFSQLLPKFQIPVSLDRSGDVKVAYEPTNNSKVNDGLSEKTQGRGAVPSASQPKFTFKARCPMDFRSKPDLSPDEVYGVERITRHHNLWALASLGVGTALVTPFIVESMFFAGPVVLSTFGTAHQDSRYRRNMGGTLTPEKEKITSNIPFVALLSGRQDWNKLFDEIKWLNGGLATLIVLLLHVI